MKNYLPKLVLGVEHTRKTIDPVISFLDDLIHDWIKVGTEAYDHPLTHIEDHWSRTESEFPEFYNSIGDFVKSRGGLYIPLQKFEDFRNAYRHILDEEYKEEVKRHERKLRESLRDGGVNSDPVFNAWDYLLNEDAMRVDDAMGRIMKRVNLKQGIDTYEDRDNRLINMTKENEPDYIIIGWNHVPALMVEFPDVKIKIIR